MSSRHSGSVAYPQVPAENGRLESGNSLCSYECVLSHLGDDYEFVCESYLSGVCSDLFLPVVDLLVHST